MVTLTTEQIKELEAYLMEIPAKFANPILGYLGKIAQEQLKPETSENSGVNGTFGTSGTK
jgi:hypothetical protein